MPLPSAFTFSPAIRMWVAGAMRTCGPGLRTFPVGRYIIIYRVEGDDVLISHVIPGDRDIEPLL